MTTQPLNDADSVITRTIAALIAAQDLTIESLAGESGINRTTMFRRMKLGGWSANEVARVALRLGRPVADLYSGLDGRLDPDPTAAVHHIAEARTTKRGLPRLDSNQQPLGYRGSRGVLAMPRLMLSSAA